MQTSLDSGFRLDAICVRYLNTCSLTLVPVMGSGDSFAVGMFFDDAIAASHLWFQTLRPRNQGVTTSPRRPIVLHGSLFNSFLWERPTWRGSNSPPWKRSRMAHRSDSEASRLGLNLLLSNHCHWHRLVCYASTHTSTHTMVDPVFE